jgi:hypothetical protein
MKPVIDDNHYGRFAVMPLVVRNRLRRGGFRGGSTN